MVVMKYHTMTQNADSSSSAPSISTPAAQPQPAALTGRMITRQQLAAAFGLSVRSIDELTHTGVLPYFKIGKAVRYDLTEAGAAFRARFYVPAQGRAGRGLHTATDAGSTVFLDTTKYHASADHAMAAASSTLTTNPAA